MSWWWLLLLSQTEPAAPTVRLSPIAALVLQVNELVGATTKDLQVSTELDEPERLELERALRTLYTLVPEAPVRLSVRHTKEGLLALVSGPLLPERRVLVDWPAVPAPKTEAKSQEAPPLDEEARHTQLLAYRRQQLDIEPVVRTMAYPMLGFGFGTWEHDRRSWQAGMASPGVVPISTAPNDWLILRGRAEVLDELDFAKLLGDPALVNRVEEARFWPRLLWGAGFGTAALLAGGAGAYLVDDRQDDTLGVSLLAVAGASAVMALFFPAVGADHTLSSAEAEVLVDNYNDSLRRDLGLRPSDL